MPVLTQFYIDVLKHLIEGKNFDEVIQEISKDSSYPKFLLEQDEECVETSSFNSNRKSEIFIKQAFPGAMKCPICGGFLHVNSISIDHIVRKQDGGQSHSANGQATHFYCNTTYKN